MNTVNKPSRILGIAFLIQAVSSLVGGLIWKQGGLIVSGKINIANRPWLIETYILCEMITAVGVIFLGAVLFVTLKKQNEQMALVALGCYILEGALLAASKLPAFGLLRLSQEYVVAGHPVNLQVMGNLAMEATDYGMTLLMLAFCLGAIPFYYLLDKARIVPRVLSLWGLLTVFPCLIGTLFSLFGNPLPFAIYVPYAPFEFVIGVWILVKGIKDNSEDRAAMRRGYLPDQAVG
jgi:hypothetical protein